MRAGLSDLNGDGLQDYYWRKEGESQVRVHWNIGHQFVGDGTGFGGVSTTEISRTFVDVAEFDGEFIESGSSESKTRLLDYDEDGRVDLLYSSRNSVTGQWSPPYVKFNTGDELWPGYPLSELDASSVQQKSWAMAENAEFIWKTYAESIDIDGDGSVERVHVAGSALEQQRIDFAGKPARVLTGIHNGRGLHTEVRYAPLSDSSVVTSDPATRRASPHTQWVVASLTTTDDFEDSTNATTYKYRYPHWSPDDRGKWGFRGFDVVRSTNVRGAVTEERFDYSADWSGRLAETLTFAAEHNPTSLTAPASIKRTEWARYTLFGGAIETFHPTISRTYTCDLFNNHWDPTHWQSEVECLADPAALVRDETIWTALGSTTSGNPLPLLYAQTSTVLQDGENFDHGDRRTEQSYDLRADGTTYRLRPTWRSSWWQNGSSLEEYERSRTVWDAATHRFASQEHVYSDAEKWSTTARSYDPTGLVLEVTRPEQYLKPARPHTTYTYDSRKLFVATTTNELGHVVATTYDYGTGAALRTIGPNGHSCGTSCGGNLGQEETRTDIDGLGRAVARWVTRDAQPGYQLVKVARTTYADGGSGTPAYIASEMLIDYGGNRWTAEVVALDGHGRPTETAARTDQGHVQTSVYDYAADGTVASVTLPSPEVDGDTVTYSYGYDSIGRPTSIRRPDGTALTGSGVDLSYAGVTHTRTEVAGAGGGPAAVTELVHDAFGRLAVVRERVDASSFASTFYEYDPRNIVTRIDDPEGVDTALVHDWAGRRIRITRGSRTWSYGYDRNGNLTFEVSPLPVLNPPPPTLTLDYTTSYTYDDLDRISTKLAAPRDFSVADRNLFGIGETDYTYDRSSDGTNRTGRLSQVDAPNLATNYNYDAEGNVTADYRTGGFGGLKETRRVLTTYGPSGRVVSVDHGDGTTVNAVATRSRFAYDARGQAIAAFIGQSGAAPTTELATLQRNLAGLIVHRSLPGTRPQTSTWDYDSLGRVVRQEVSVGSESQALQTLTYWGGDDPKTLAHSGSGLADRTFSFGYDQRHQLTGVTTTPSSFTASYMFRPSGRLDTVNVQYPSPATGSDVRPRAVTHRYEAGDPEMLTKLESGDGTAFATYDYDEAGNIKTRVQEGISTTFLYDGDDQLRRAVTSTGREDYYYDHAGSRVAIVKRSAAGAVQELRYFQGSLETWRGPTGTLTKTLAHINLGTPLARVENRRTLELQYHSTLQSLLVSLTSSGLVNSSFVYGPYGEVLQTSGSKLATHRRRYNDKHKDEFTNLSYYGYRYYDPVAQIWTSSDPRFRFTPESAWASPRKANLYGFNQGNPLRHIDPDGREDVPVLHHILEANPSAMTPSVAYGQFKAGGERDAAIRNADFQNIINEVPGLNVVLPIAADLILGVDTAGITSSITQGVGTRAYAGANNIDIQSGGFGVPGPPGKSSGGGDGPAPSITIKYKRPNGATTRKQRESVQDQPCVTCGADGRMNADHKKPLVEEYYETGTIDKGRMKENDAVQPQCPGCSNQQGGKLAQWARAMRKKLGID